MSSAAFTRDEVILALDVLYSCDKRYPAADSQAIQDLSALLNRLPIHPKGNRQSDFRNMTGVARQIMLFSTSCRTGKCDPNVGSLFFAVAYEFENRHEELHAIAQAIRQNEPYYTVDFGSRFENNGFPEGALLGHLHRCIEVRDGAKVPIKQSCEICSLQPSLCYQPCGELLQLHLCAPPTKLNGNKRYSADDFLTVCPNCHEALHRYRPWRTKENCGDVLR